MSFLNLETTSYNHFTRQFVTRVTLDAELLVWFEISFLTLVTTVFLQLLQRSTLWAEELSLTNM